MATQVNDSAETVNDIHSQLNSTVVGEVLTPETVEDVAALVRYCRMRARPLAVAGGRHAMGGQQFGAGMLLVDMRRMNRVVRLDQERGLLEVEAGTMWPDIVAYLESPPRWSIIQKQTGADNFTIGGSLAANAHGSGLNLKPMIDDVESFELVDARGQLVQCDRTCSNWPLAAMACSASLCV
jgi:FAD/FMN-containing dehydrogenase